VKWLGLALVPVIAFAAAPAAEGAKRATVTGKLTGAKLPSRSNGRVPVWALRISNGKVAAGTYASAKGRFTLKMPKGSYAILAAVIPERGRKNPLVRVADFVTAKAGKKMRIKPTLKKRHKRKHKQAHASALARAAWVDVDRPVVWVHRWSLTQGSRSELKVMEKGMQDMVITDLSAAIGTPACQGSISAGDDLPLVLGEIKLSQSKYFDPATKMTTDKLVRPNASLTGTMTTANGQLTLTATYQERRSGRSGTVSVSGPEDSIFDLEQALIPKIAKLVCAETPKTYAGTFSGTFTTQRNNYKVTWTGDAVIQLLTEHGSPPPDGPPPSDYAHYVVQSGKVHAVLDGTRVGGGTCTIHGEATFSLTPGIASGQDFVQVDVDRPWYALSITGRGDEAIPYTETGSGCNQQNPQYPLTGVQFAYTPKPLQSADGFHLTGNTSWDQFTFSHFTSQFTFTPTS
jgi:hypothetical protein